jgi:hypothetical protein
MTTDIQISNLCKADKNVFHTAAESKKKVYKNHILSSTNFKWVPGFKKKSWA